MNALEILTNTRKNCSGMLSTSKGGAKESIYRKEIFAECTEREKKSIRKKLRNLCRALIEKIIQCPDNEKLLNEFVNFYKFTYRINDFSLSSLCSENTKEEEKAQLSKGLEIVKSFVSSDNKEEKKKNKNK